MRTSRDIAFAMPCRAVDITYLPMRREFLYLVAIHCPTVVCLQTMRGMDWHTRTVLAWRISNTLEAEFCPSRQICFTNRLPGNGAMR